MSEIDSSHHLDRLVAVDKAFRLTPRELEVAAYLALRRTNAEIAEALAIREKTAKNHVQRILGKLGLRSRRGVADVMAGTKLSASRRGAWSGAGLAADRILAIRAE